MALGKDRIGNVGLRQAAGSSEGFRGAAVRRALVTIIVVGLAAVPIRAAGGSYVTGFEPGEGFNLGFLDNQAGWEAFGSSIDPIVSDANPAAGDQHLRLAGDPGLHLHEERRQRLRRWDLQR